MPGGKAPIRGAVGWPLKLPLSVVDPESLLKWRRCNHFAPSPDELSCMCEKVRVALARYFGFVATTPTLTVTERRRLLQKAKRGELDSSQLDVNTRAIFYANREARGRRWPDPFLPNLINELAEIWEMGTGRSPRTRDPGNGEYPFYDWVFDLFKACGKPRPAEHNVRDILAQSKPEKSRP